VQLFVLSAACLFALRSSIAKRKASMRRIVGIPRPGAELDVQELVRTVAGQITGIGELPDRSSSSVASDADDHTRLKFKGCGMSNKNSLEIVYLNATAIKPSPTLRVSIAPRSS
jgi:hypothetical protein